jgi:hypothetical protein
MIILVKKLLTAFSIILIFTSSLNAQSYWQQQVNFNIQVSLNDKEHTLTGSEKIEYINNSPDTLTYIWFHIWPNAYKNDQTAFSDQMLENDNTTFYFSSREDKGYINKLNFRVNNITAETEDHPEHIDIIKLILPTPLLPGKKIDITTPFHVKLPANVSRGGHDGQSYQASQWYPKPAVYDRNGWHPMPYLDQGEYYNEFGNYDVTITVPENYVVAATGTLQDAREKEWLTGRKTYFWEPVKKKIKTKGGSYKTTYEKFPASSTDIKTIRFTQERVHDFAWFADKRFVVDIDTCTLPSGKVIELFNYYTAEYAAPWANNIGKMKAALLHYSSLIADYPYNTLSVVQGPKAISGGMEYPSITVISPIESEKELDLTIAHEIGHNWFQGALATNERMHPWMDEGINTFYERKYSVKHYGPEANKDRLLLETKEITGKDQVISTPSTDFSSSNYGLVGYYKASEWLMLLEQQLGTETFNKAMKAYYNEWQFAHPAPEDFKRSIQKSTGQNSDSIFGLLNARGTLPHLKREGTRFNFLLSKKSFRDYLVSPTKHLITYSPAIGLNSYDKIMLGGLITNMKLPPSRFQFLAIPMYATGSSKFNGLGLAVYSFYPKKGIERIDIGVSGSKFTKDKFETEDGKDLYFQFNKVVPGFRLTFRNKSPRSEMYKYLQFKSYFINEENLSFRRDTTTYPDSSIFVPFTLSESRMLNQLTLVIENARALYPYRAELKAEQGEGFIRLAFTGNYFFNYASNNGGVDLRLFAGKFIYTNEEKADPFLYGLNMSAPKGNLDYTYSDYFIGRNDYPFRSGGEQWTVPYQQIMIRDGAFKVNTDAQGNVGWSDNWLTSLNATFDIPKNVNPLHIFGIGFPFKAFVDIGTYSQVWQKGETADRFLYDAGIQLPLLKGLVNVYIPIFYSKVFSDYYKSTVEKKGRLLKTFSFSIDISKFNSKRFLKEVFQ